MIKSPLFNLYLFTFLLKRNRFFKRVVLWFSITITNIYLSGFHSFEGYFLDKKKHSLGLTALELNQLLKVYLGLNSLF